MKSHLQALIVIAVAFGALVGILAAAGQPGMTCSCWTPVGFPPTCLVNPCPAHEMLVMESYKVNPPTNATLTIMNTSPLDIGFSYYQVIQSNGAQFTHDNWTEPTLPPGQSFDANILIAGAPFTYQSGTSYEVILDHCAQQPVPIHDKGLNATEL